MQKIAVIGSGAMGTGIGQIAAGAGCDVVFYDSLEASLQRSQQSLTFTMESLIVKKKISSEDAKSLLAKCTWTSQLKDISGVDLVIEAVVEDAGIKKTLFESIEKLVSPNCIITSNTSSISITSLAASLENPSRFAGLHFFNPAPVMKLVEVIPSLQTEKEIISQLLDLMRSWSKVPVLARDTPGFIVNRVARPFYGEALRIFDEGLATCTAIDDAMKEIGGFRMGPFELMDFIGNDVNYRVTESVYHSMYHDPRYKPSLTQRSLMEAGWLGRKSGKGFYNYPGQDETISYTTNNITGEEIFTRIISMLINEAADAIYMGICSEEDVDNAMKLGTNYPKGLISWGREIGFQLIADHLKDLNQRYMEDRYRPSPNLLTL